MTVVKIDSQKKKCRVKMSSDGRFVPVEDEFDWWVTKYELVGNKR